MWEDIRPGVLYRVGIDQSSGGNACSESYLVPAGRTAQFSLTVRVDQVVPGAQGSVAMAWSPDASWRPPFDPNAADDSAALTLN
jgi:hypothetical protein